MIPATFDEFKKRIRARGNALRNHKLHPQQERGVVGWHGGMYPGGHTKRRGRVPKVLDDIPELEDSDIVEP